MAKCIMCGGGASFLSGVKALDGSLCGNCIKMFPKSIRPSMGGYSKNKLDTILEYMKSLDRDSFMPTASFGDLHIDEIHGMFAISGNAKNKGGGDIPDLFYCLSLKEVALTPTNVRYERNTRSVRCDFELHCSFEYPDMSFKTMVNKRVACTEIRKNKTELTYSLPGTYWVFLEMFDQMLATARKKYNEASIPKFISKPAFDLFKAETLFMLSEGYDMDEVNEQRDALCTAFDGQQNYIDIINCAYMILADKLSGDEDMERRMRNGQA